MSEVRETPDGAVSVRRRVNDAAAELAERLDENDGGLFEFVCECGDPGCHAVVTLTVAEYRIHAPGSVLAHVDERIAAQRRRAKTLHTRAAEVHEESANLHEEHAAEMREKGRPASVERAERIADRERELAAEQRRKADDS